MEPTVQTAMPNTHEHRYFIEETFLDDIPIDLMVCGICGYSPTKVYVD